MSDQSSSTPSRKPVWARGLWMLVMAVLAGFAVTILHVMTLLQFILMLTDGGKPNPQIAAFGQSIADWLAKAARFQTGNTEDKPWPWAPMS